MSDERVQITKEEAISMLPDGEQIHTFKQGGPCLIGGDWSREDMMAAIEKYDFELSGEKATGMGHGMVFLDEHGYVFVEAKVH